MRKLLGRLRRCRGGTLAPRRKGTQMAAEWHIAVIEAREATGFTYEVVQRTIDGIGTGLRLDHRADFYRELGALGDSGGFEAFLNHWWTQALADSAPDEEARSQAIDFADVTVSLYARAVGGPTSTQEQIETIAAGTEVS